MSLHDRDRKSGRLSFCYCCTVMSINFLIRTRTFFQKLHTYAPKYTFVLAYNIVLVSVWLIPYPLNGHSYFPVISCFSENEATFSACISKIPLSLSRQRYTHVIHKLLSRVFSVIWETDITTKISHWTPLKAHKKCNHSSSSEILEMHVCKDRIFPWQFSLVS